MIAIANEEALYFLAFTDHRGREQQIERLKQRTQSTITSGATHPILSIQNELKAYFNGTLRVFNTSIFQFGSPFQKNAWDALCRIPYGETRSYREQAITVSNPSAYRAVANANGANPLSIIVPCHRIINSNGARGGYGGGIDRKQWLINHEKNSLIGIYCAYSC